jgi:hypothetical protein
MLSRIKNWLIFALACVALTLSCQWAFDHLLDRLGR